MKTHRDMEIWQNGLQMVKDVYSLTRIFPKKERNGLADQVRRAAVSIPANIAEGTAGGSYRELRHFYRIAMGSLVELETLWLLSLNLNCITKVEYEFLQNQIVSLTAQLSGILKSIESKPNT
jgi:four helix bundle protein